MTDKVIRITSQQGFADTWKNVPATPANNTVPTTLNLCDFTIPSGYVIDMSSSYVAFNTDVYADNAVVNAGLVLDTDDGANFNVPNSALIRNCAISCSNAGQLESIRRNDTLSCGIWGLSHTAEEAKSDMNTLSVYNNGAGQEVSTSFSLDRVSNNVNPAGTAVLTGLNGLPLTSENISRDVKIPLKDLFGVGVVEDWDTSKWGETRIHLETNFNKLGAVEYGGNEDTLDGFTTGTKQGSIVPPVAAVPAGTAVPLLIELEHKSGEWEYTCPFFVGQKVLINATASAGANVINEERTITSIQFQLDNTASPITGNSAVYIGLDTAYYTAPAANPSTLTDVLMKAKIQDEIKITVNRAELVLYTKEGGNTSSAYEYTTYSTEEDNGNNIAVFNRGYMLEPEAENVFIALLNDTAILPTRSINSYRFAINNDEQTGNRDIPMVNNAKQGSPLQYERLTRCLDRSAQIPFRNPQLKYYLQGQTQALSYQSPISMICEPVEVMKSSKMLNLHIDSVGLAQIVIYKQLPKRISI